MGIDRHGGQGAAANANAEGPRPMGVETVFVFAGAKRRVRTARPRAIHIYEQIGETRMCMPHFSRQRSCRGGRHGKGRVALLRPAGERVCSPPSGTGAFFSLERIAGLAIRGGDDAAGQPAGLPNGIGRRQRAARSMRCARPSDLHPNGRIAGSLARMRATAPAGSGGDGRRGMPLSVAREHRVPGGGRHGRNLRAR
jgi:hypothetical protein